MARYAQTFERVNFKVRPVLSEEVEVVFETDAEYEEDAYHAAMWAALWEQSGWQSKPWPAGFSSALTKGRTRKL